MIQVSARIFPIGFLIEVDNANFNPNNFYLNGVWERYGNGRVIVGVDENQTEFNTTSKTGGSKKLQDHWHPIPYDSGTTQSVSKDKFLLNGYNNKWDANVGTLGSGEGNSGNLQPFITAYRWKLISYSD